MFQSCLHVNLTFFQPKGKYQNILLHYATIFKIFINLKAAIVGRYLFVMALFRTSCTRPQFRRGSK